MSVRKELVLAATCVALITSCGPAFAAEGAIHPCAKVPDSADRLACYDQAFSRPAEPVAATPVAAAPVSAAPEAHFGFKEMEVRRQSEQSAEPAVPTSVSAAITSVGRQHDGKFMVTLDNAQVWSQSEFSSLADVRIGDAITVRRGLLGSYLLITKAGIATRVKRVK